VGLFFLIPVIPIRILNCFPAQSVPFFSFHLGKLQPGRFWKKLEKAAKAVIF